MANESSELLPCPFCGNTVIKIDFPAKKTIRIRCGKCLICYIQKYLRFSENDLLNAMIGVWNRRAK